MKQVFFFAALVLSSNAFANWQYTQWGDSMEKILEKNKNLQKSETSGQVILKGKYDSGGHGVFLVAMFFKDDKLSTVLLEQTSHADCIQIHQGLTDKYGAGVIDGDNITWRDNAIGNLVKFSDLEKLSKALGWNKCCDVVYSSIVEAGDGL